MIKGIHVEPTNICTLKCSECRRTQFIAQWPQHWKNQSIDIDLLMNFLDIDLKGLRVLFCGNYGDPIYHPEFIRLVESFKKRSAIINITTNGSYRQENWWQSLCDVLDSQDLVEFSVDGIPENFTQYRENADWPSIRKGMEICVKSNIGTAWKYIPFLFNEHTIDQAQQLSDQLGIQKFHLSRSWRFNNNKALIPSQQHLISPKKLVQNDAITKQNLKVDPMCDNGNGSSHFISATGHYSPCCMISDHNWYYKTEFGKNQVDYDISSTTISQILDRPRVIEFYNNISQTPIVACQFQCPSGT